MSNSGTRRQAPSRKLSDEEKLATFMRSFHTMCQKPYWGQLRDLGRVDLVADADMKVNLDTGQVAMEVSPLDPLAVDLAGAYMRKLITGTDIVDFGNLLNVLKRVAGPDPYLDEARRIWRQTEARKFDFLADGDQITTIKMNFPREWTEGRPRDEGERREVKLSIVDFAKPYFYTGFLHDFDENLDNMTRKLVRSMPSVIRERFSHLAIAISIYISIIAHHIISIRRPDLCPKGCREAAIMARHAALEPVISDQGASE